MLIVLTENLRLCLLLRILQTFYEILVQCLLLFILRYQESELGDWRHVCHLCLVFHLKNDVYKQPICQVVVPTLRKRNGKQINKSHSFSRLTISYAHFRTIYDKQALCH